MFDVQVSPGQRKADAVDTIFRFFLDHHTSPPGTRHRPHLDLIAHADTVHGGRDVRIVGGAALDPARRPPNATTSGAAPTIGGAPTPGGAPPPAWPDPRPTANGPATGQPRDATTDPPAPGHDRPP
jgi:hypothetical protein